MQNTLVGIPKRARTQTADEVAKALGRGHKFGLHFRTRGEGVRNAWKTLKRFSEHGIQFLTGQETDMDDPREVLVSPIDR